ncbi:MAG TPA: isoprenylcysteine carboxylmethyltransferase family protein [Baekduia sp.]|uniref:methyltransferase family protein n=1 Tax=Baekduia sp. TaxID=2600305 RepID=UPI002D794F25|nr:isoprenylcysteine carboxylmethyltransferase family protein [Baekduia sp.]HET6509338.1 isoprenylcysteine carboxylmethyltransferase family protein [Baekduia sp.]
MRTVVGNLTFALVGPGLEAVVGPYLLVRVAGSDLDWPFAVRALGVLLIVLGVAVLLDVFRRFAREGRGTPSPAAPARDLMRGGVFGVVRHPMYVATATIVVGEALAFAQPVLLVGAAAYLAAMATLSALVEEPMLARRHGPAFEAYRREVPGWIPRPRWPRGPRRTRPRP